MILSDEQRNNLEVIRLELVSKLADPRKIQTQEGKEMANSLLRIIEIMIGGKPVTESIKRHHV